MDLYSHYIKVGKNISSNIIKNTNCNNNAINKLLSHLKSYQGIIPTEALEHFPQITIHSKKVMILNITSFLESHLKDNQQITHLKTHSLNSGIGINRLSDLKFSCTGCNSSNLATATLDLQGQKQSFHFETGTLQKVLVSLRAIKPYEKLDSSMFQYKMMPLKNNLVSFSDVNELKYYQLAKSLKTGSPLLLKNAIKSNIIKYGSHVTCQYNNKGISLKSQAIAKSNGRINDFISLMHPKTKKTFNGKVIGINKVQVEI